MCIRIQLSRATVKDLHSRLQHAYQRDDVRLVRRTTVLLTCLSTTCPSKSWRPLGPQHLVHLPMAPGFPAAGDGQLGLPPRRWSPTEVDPTPETPLGRAH